MGGDKEVEREGKVGTEKIGNCAYTKPVTKRYYISVMIYSGKPII